MTNYDSLIFEKNGALASIRLNRPKAANGLNASMARDLRRAAAQCDADTDIKAVLLSAEGKFFCVGGDLKELASHNNDSADMLKRLADDLHAALSTFARMRAPLVVAVNGMAAGAGFSIVAAGDIVVAASGSVFTMAYTKAGLSPDGGSTHYFPRLIGLRRTQDLMLTNRQLSAEEALEWGIVTRIAPDETVDEEARAIAERLSEGPSEAQGFVKALLLNSHDTSLESQMELEARSISQCLRSENGQEGVAAFLEKRAPKFR
ncbi:MAG: enoyl-CoA hydratase [Marinicaulis sp.]|nr:enoyl-CoA hydratase [Marinicaulis sp.]